MLHHHLPPWATLKARLNFFTVASHKKSSQRDLVAVSKDSRPTHFNKDYYWGKGHGPYINRVNPIAGNDLESLENVGDYIGGAGTETCEDDRIYLKHDPQQD